GLRYMLRWTRTLVIIGATPGPDCNENCWPQALKLFICIILISLDISRGGLTFAHCGKEVSKCPRSVFSTGRFSRLATRWNPGFCARHLGKACWPSPGSNHERPLLLRFFFLQSPFVH